MLIFMDFDGVPHPTPCFQDNLLCRLANLESVLREYPDIELVISSSWRNHHTLQTLAAMFSVDIGARIVGVTPPTEAMPAEAQAYVRQYEIEIWITENRPWSKWIALDDQPHLFEKDCPNLLVTDPSMGFLIADQQRLRDKIIWVG